MSEPDHTTGTAAGMWGTTGTGGWTAPVPMAEPAPLCAPGCYNGWQGDHYCDHDCDNAACNFDGGDCAPAPMSEPDHTTGTAAGMWGTTGTGGWTAPMPMAEPDHHHEDASGTTGGGR